MAVGISKFDLRSIFRNLIIVEFEEFFFREEDDRLLENLELRAMFIDEVFPAVTFPDCPIQEPFEITILLLDRLLFQFFIDTEEADVFVDTGFIEILVTYGTMMLSSPTGFLHFFDGLINIPQKS